MNIVSITPAKLKGTVVAPASKSFLHRAMICGALSGGKCNIFSVTFSEDILATLNGIKEIGSNIITYANSLTINQPLHNKKNIVIDCHESGSTLRFLIPVVAVLGLSARFKRSLSLSKRPIIEYLEILKNAGVKSEICRDLSLKTSGRLCSGEFFIRGNISSQFISGLLMTLPLINGNSKIKMTSKLESSSYVDITMDVMKRFGVYVEKTSDGFFINGNQKYKPIDYVIEGDWSQAAFFLAAGALNGRVSIKNLNKNSCQGDKKIFELLSKFGANISWNKDLLMIRKSNLKGIDIDVSQIPDLVPILAVIAANSEYVTNIINADRLRFKECNRLEAIYNQLKGLGVDIKRSDQGLIINGKAKLGGGTVWSHNDHRIAMALSILGVNLSGNINVIDAQSVRKSYPCFFEDYNSIGGKANVINMGE